MIRVMIIVQVIVTLSHGTILSQILSSSDHHGDPGRDGPGDRRRDS